MTARKRPATTDRPLPRHRANGSANPTATARHHGHDRHEPLDADDRAELAVLNAAAELGYRLAVQCTRCGAWLVASKSVALHLGPVCRSRVTP